MNHPERHRNGIGSSLLRVSVFLTVFVSATLIVSAPTALYAQSLAGTWPDAPSALRPKPSPSSTITLRLEDQDSEDQDSQQSHPQRVQPDAATILPTQTTSLPPCPKVANKGRVPIIFLPSTRPSCEDPLQLIVDTGRVSPLTARQKATLATRDITDPFNLLTIGFFSAITVAANPHTVYGPGFAGWGRESGYSLAEDVQGEYTGTFVIPSLAHEDPRYHRMPGAPISRRIEHALIHTLISQHDNGSLMLNYATLINYPLSAEITNLYVPNVGTNLPSTTKRVLAGYATDPIGPLLAEFLPDFAKRVHIHVVFAQQILNHMAPGSGEGGSSF